MIFFFKNEFLKGFKENLRVASTCANNKILELSNKLYVGGHGFINL